MSHDVRRASPEVVSRVERTLLRCLEWSQLGRHRRVLQEVEGLLPLVRDDDHLASQLLIWKSQALLAMGLPDRALPAASDSWELEPSPHACHLMSAALAALGEQDESEHLLRAGGELFPDAVHLPVQLAMQLTEQGRLPEAFDILTDLPQDVELPEDLEIFVVGLRANILATMGRWPEADGVLRDGIGRHPESSLLREARTSIGRAWCRERAERRLIASWEAGLTPLDDPDIEVDEAVESLSRAIECPRLVSLAARRLWRAMLEHDPVRPQVPEAWAVALLAAVWEIDGAPRSVAALARAARVSPSTARTSLARVRSFVGGLDPEMARRGFGAMGNPRLEARTLRGQTVDEPSGDVIPFPTS
jgi:hypothetical protein